MKYFFFLFSFIIAIGCQKAENQEAKPLLKEINYDTVTINNHRFIVGQVKEEFTFILNEKNDTIYKHPDWTFSTEFKDFDEDGFKDIIFNYVTNIPNIFDVALFEANSNSFKLLYMQNFPTAVKLKGTKYYYSNQRMGCASENWASDLFFIDDFKTTQIGNIYIVGCENEKKGIFISTVKDGKENLITELPLAYYSENENFIEEYWKENFKKFE